MEGESLCSTWASWSYLCASNRGQLKKEGKMTDSSPWRGHPNLPDSQLVAFLKPIVLCMPTDPGAFCCIALGRGVFFWQNNRRLCPRARENGSDISKMSSTKMAKGRASYVLAASSPSQKIKDRKCLQKSKDNHDFLPVTSISSGFKIETRDLWWHDSFQALEKVPVCLELCPFPPHGFQKQRLCLRYTLLSTYSKRSWSQ